MEIYLIQITHKNINLPNNNNSFLVINKFYKYKINNINHNHTIFKTKYIKYKLYVRVKNDYHLWLQIKILR